VFEPLVSTFESMHVSCGDVIGKDSYSYAPCYYCESESDQGYKGVEGFGEDCDLKGDSVPNPGTAQGMGWEGDGEARLPGRGSGSDELVPGGC
jgi:hypothetical protein